MKLIEKPANFISEVNQEMSKVSWPTSEELKESTLIVIVLSIAFAIFIFISDTILSKLLKFIF
jgi:preprotein translocase subunit SecE